MRSSPEPVVIGGIGGSGTRIPAMVCQEIGYDFGATNYAMDALAFRSFLDQWILGYLTGKAANSQMAMDFQGCLEWHKSTIDSHLWGWKNPRNIYLIQFYFDMLPGMKFIHVVRSKQDMARSNNQQQFKSFAELFLSRQEFLSDRNKQLFWQRVNVFVSAVGRGKASRYLQINFRDLLSGQAIQEMLDFLGQEGDAMKIKAKVINV